MNEPLQRHKNGRPVRTGQPRAKETLNNYFLSLRAPRGHKLSEAIQNSSGINELWIATALRASR